MYKLEFSLSFFFYLYRGGGEAPTHLKKHKGKLKIKQETVNNYHLLDRNMSITFYGLSNSILDFDLEYKFKK